jgi:hypothetical protein
VVIARQINVSGCQKHRSGDRIYTTNIYYSVVQNQSGNEKVCRIVLVFLIVAMCAACVFGNAADACLWYCVAVLD